jgi:hypothetical protein
VSAFAVSSAGVAVAVCVVLLVALGSFVRAASATGSADVEQASTPSMFAGIARARVVAAICALFVTLMFTRWPLLALFVGALVLLWGRLLHDSRADDERRRVEGIAKWLEDLRDTLRGSSIGAEDALEQVALRPPEAIAAPLRHFVHRRRQGFRTEDALADLADELAHPTSDSAVAAIRLVIGGSTSAGRLYGTVHTLAEAARDEVTARERIDRTRAIYQNSMKRLVIIGALLVAYLKFAGGDLLDPYGSPIGQIVLVVPLAMWLGCVLWLRSLCRYEMPRRYRIVGSEERVA